MSIRLDNKREVEIDPTDDGKIQLGVWDNGNGTVVIMTTDKAREIVNRIICILNGATS